MKMCNKFFRRFKKEASIEREMVTARTIMAVSEDTVSSIFDQYKMVLLDKNIDYVIYAVCGATPLTREQMDIYRRVNLAVDKIYDLLKLDNLFREEKKDILLIIRSMLEVKILFMMELFKNNRNQKLAMKENLSSLKNIKSYGHA